MRKFFNRGMMLLASALTIASCTNEAEEMRPQGTRALDVQVAVNPTSRAQVIGTSLPEGAKIGVNVTATDGSEYDGQNAGYLNVAYTATGTDATQTWGSTTPVMLSGTEGKLYAYYPHTADVDYKAIEVDIADQHDWMVGAEAYTVSDKAPSVAITMNHVQTALNINVVRDNAYTGDGEVTALAITSEGLASEGTLDTRDGSWSAVNGANTAISIISAPFTLDGTTLSSQENPYMFIPASDETKGFTVSATVDGKAYQVPVAMNEAFAKGKVYKLNVNITNTGLTVGTVTLTDWVIDTTLPDAELEPVTPTIKVYAMSANDEIIDYTTADVTAKGVVLHATGKNFDKKFMIAKSDASNDGSNYEIYYDYDKGDLSLTNYSNADGTNNYGRLGIGLSTDFTTWTAGALSDFNGKSNTQVIAASSSNAEDMCKALETFNDGSDNQGHNDWYVPACGQLALMYLAKTDINAALAKIGGTGIVFESNGLYWSSSEYVASSAWYVDFYDGDVYGSNKSNGFRVRFVRDIE